MLLEVLIRFCSISVNWGLLTLSKVEKEAGKDGISILGHLRQVMLVLVR